MIEMQLFQIAKANFANQIFYDNAKTRAARRDARIPTLKELIQLMEETVIERENGTSIKGRFAFIEKFNGYLPCFTSTFARADIWDVSTYGREIQLDVWNDGEQGFRMRVLNNPSVEENFSNEPLFGLPVLAQKGRGYSMAFNTVSGFNGPILFHPYEQVIASGVQQGSYASVLAVKDAAADAAVL